MDLFFLYGQIINILNNNVYILLILININNIIIAYDIHIYHIRGLKGT
jgi:hypothetical protein